MKIRIGSNKDELNIVGDDFNITGSNLMIYTLSRFLENNTIKDSITVSHSEGTNYTSFEVHDNLFKNLNIIKIKEKML